jgi:hypothetical protein
MARRVLLCALLLATIHCVACQPKPKSNVTFSSIQPPKLAVTITNYDVDGMNEIAGPICTGQQLNSDCLTTINADRDSVSMTYTVLPQFDANLTDTVSLKACYSNYSAEDRPWRKYNDNISKSKRCPFLIAKGLDPESGNATWMPNANVPTATYFIRAFVNRKNPTNPETPIIVATGISMGFFKVEAIDSTPTNMKIASGICACVGPIFFFSYIVYAKFTGKA